MVRTSNKAASFWRSVMLTSAKKTRDGEREREEEGRRAFPRTPLKPNPEPFHAFEPQHYRLPDRKISSVMALKRKSGTDEA